MDGRVAGGWVQDLTGGYTTPSVVTALVTLTAGVIVLIARPVAPVATH